MSKQSGLGDALYLSGYNLSGDINSYSNSGGPTLIDVTGIDKFAHERIGGLRSGKMNVTSYFNPSIGHAQPVLSALPSTDIVTTICRGTTIGSPALCQLSKQLNYDGSRDASGQVLFKEELDSNGFGQEWGVLLTAGVRTDTAAATGAPVDLGAAASFGFQAYLHVFGFTGTDATVKLQHATTVGGSYTDITSGAFPQITSTTPQAKRIAVGGTATVNRYVKATTITSGGFTSLQFAVVMMQNATAVIF